MNEHLQHQIEHVGEWFETFAASAFGLAFVVIGLCFLILVLIIWCKIWSKTGNSGFFGLLMLIPFVSFIMILVLAFSDWPVQKELRLLKNQQGKA